MSTTTRAFLVAAVLFWLTAFEALLGAGGGADAAGPHRGHHRIQCCRAGASGAPECRVKTRRACRRTGGVDMGPGTCNPKPCAARPSPTSTTSSSSTSTSSTSTSSTTSTTSTTVPPCGTFLLEWGAPLASANGELNSPDGVAIDRIGNVYVADSANHRIQKFDANGAFLTAWGSLGSGDGQFGGPDGPSGVATDGSGNVYVSDTDNSRIQKFDASGTFLTVWGSYGSGDGQFSFPSGVAADASGN